MTNRQAPADQELAERATKLACRAGLDWSLVANQSTELVVFGSQAAGLQTPFSDLDVLVVGKHGIGLQLPRLRGIDLVFRTEHEILSADWLKSELAGHIAVYGRWLQGPGQWRNKVLAARADDNEAAEAKRRRILRLAEALCNHWERLTPNFRRRNLMTLRREEQRLQLIQSGMAVPPTRLLDMWADNNSVHNCYNQHLLSSGDPPKILQEMAGGSLNWFSTRRNAQRRSPAEFRGAISGTGSHADATQSPAQQLFLQSQQR
jgi:hypothetical protein